jgi:hypothetical protein
MLFRKFTSHGKKIERSAISNVKDIINTLAGISETFTASAQTINAEWPFFTLGVFEQTASKVLKQTGFESISIANRVMLDQRDEWVNYSKEKFENITTQSFKSKYGNRQNLSESDYHPFLTKFERNDFVFDKFQDNSFPCK